MSKLTAFDKFIQQALKYGFSLFGTAKTGQTVSYDTGDDGSYQRGYPKTGPHYTDNGDGTVTCHGSGLIWAKDGNGAGCFNGGSKNWADALSWAEGLSFAGKSDWRLPNIKELFSILDFSVENPAIDEVFFPNTQGDHYWSSTTPASSTFRAFVVDFEEGVAIDESKLGSKKVRAVRGGV